MSRKRPTVSANKVENALQTAVQDILFIPNPSQRRVKARFWSRYESWNSVPEDITAAAVAQVTNEPAISRWWATPGFKEWFRNEDETRERLEYLFQVALDAAEEILLDPNAQASAKVNMIKTIGLLAGKEPARVAAEPQYLDAQVAKMDVKRLEEFVKKQALKIAQKDSE